MLLAGEVAPLPLPLPRPVGVTALDLEPFTVAVLFADFSSFLFTSLPFPGGLPATLDGSPIKLSSFPFASFTCFLGEQAKTSADDAGLVGIILVVPAMRPCGTALLIIPPAVNVTVLTAPLGISVAFGKAVAAATAAVVDAFPLPLPDGDPLPLEETIPLPVATIFGLVIVVFVAALLSATARILTTPLPADVIFTPFGTLRSSPNCIFAFLSEVALIND